MLVIFTDLDGTLLDPVSYSYDAARPALNLLKGMQVPLVFVTSKTRAEVEAWRERLGNRHPFIVENGGALFVPQNYFPPPFQAPVHRDEYAVIEFGDTYESLVQVLRAASIESQCPVVGFYDLSVQALATKCGMSLEQAVLAKKREYGEPFEILAPEPERLLASIERHKKRWTRGGRFYHILGANDKMHCVRLLIHFYERSFGEVTSLGLGDALNDVGFLEAVDIPIVLKSVDSAKLQEKVQKARFVDLPGPEGWNRAILEMLEVHGGQLTQTQPSNPTDMVGQGEAANSKEI
jgi:mannosyl-3-phosphoglycerate phosphatase